MRSRRLRRSSMASPPLVAWSHPSTGSRALWLRPRPDRFVPIYADPVDGLAVPVNLLRTWTARLIERIGTPVDIAEDVAEVLVASDARGIASHGTARLPNYVALIEAGVMDPAGR